MDDNFPLPHFGPIQTSDALKAFDPSPSLPIAMPEHLDSTLKALDGAIWSAMARSTGGASPLALATAAFDWMSHSLASPGHTTLTIMETMRAYNNAVVEAYKGLKDTEGKLAPSTLHLEAYSRLYSQMTDWFHGSVKAPRGVAKSHEKLMSFAVRQYLEAWHPDNFLFSNAHALTQTRSERGTNLVRGWVNAVEYVSSEIEKRLIGRKNDPIPQVGETLAVTPGKVVYRNHLFELIQYEPTTEVVKSEPILIVPAWILKYYILDLSAHNSMVRYLVEQGYTVFIMSWRNPDKKDQDLSFDDYRRLGVDAAIEAVQSIIPNEQIHGVGYCLGGTLLSITASGHVHKKRDPFASITLLAAQVDFTEPGELELFINSSQLSFLDANMQSKGFLAGDQMSGAFALLHSRELIWQRLRETYLMGRRSESIDLMIWNSDLTRMPYKMHTEYLQRLFLSNDFVEGRMSIDGHPIAPSDIRAPIFALGTIKDHVAPWRSVFKIHLFADADVTFALTNGGHNAGVVSPPDHPRRHHQIYTRPDKAPFIDPDTWLEIADQREGSWWPSWSEWLGARSSKSVAARNVKRADTDSNLILSSKELEAAPGRYVRHA